MDWSAVIGAVVGTGSGSIVTGFAAWAAFSRRLGVVSARFEDEKGNRENQHSTCRTEMKQEIGGLREEIAKHADEKNHPPEIFRTLLMGELGEIKKRLGSIEEYLRNGG